MEIKSIDTGKACMIYLNGKLAGTIRGEHRRILTSILVLAIEEFAK